MTKFYANGTNSLLIKIEKDEVNNEDAIFYYITDIILPTKIELERGVSRIYEFGNPQPIVLPNPIASIRVELCGTNSLITTPELAKLRSLEKVPNLEQEKESTRWELIGEDNNESN